jgi:hypothetical protein
VKQKSRDFFWYSPVLKRQLDHLTADLVVSPRDEAEVVQVLKACHALGVPVTPRGSGTGNYGQAMPLAGGIILNLADMNAVKSVVRGRAVAEAGAILAQIDRRAREELQEIRLHPSTYNTASIGGFIAGGSGGVGSINWGGLRDPGNVLRLRVVTMEAEPRILDLRSGELEKVMHAYGTNGIITEVEIPLDAAYDWVDVMIGFDDYLEAVRFANELANSDGLLFKEIATVAAPVPHDYFLRHRSSSGASSLSCSSWWRRMRWSRSWPWPAAPMPTSCSAPTRRATPRRRGCRPSTSSPGTTPPCAASGSTRRSLTCRCSIPSPPTWRACGYDRALRGRGAGHLEFIRFNGNVACAGLPIVRFTSEERLDEIIRIHEENGCPVFNPHRYTLEEGGMKQTDAVQLAFKREADPQGLLNPGKMIAWDNPDYDFPPGQTYLFPSLQRRGDPRCVCWWSTRTPSRRATMPPSMPARWKRCGGPDTRSTTATSTPRASSPCSAARNASPIMRSGPTWRRSPPMSKGCDRPKRWCCASPSGTSAFPPS